MTEPSERTKRLHRTYERQRRETAKTRANLRQAIRDDLARGVTQADLARLTGFTRETIRTIAHEQD